jgi:hypothetical protein
LGIYGLTEIKFKKKHINLIQVTLVRRVDTEILLERMRKNPQATRPFDTTKTAIIKRLNGEDEDDVQMDSLKISLIDPV